MRKLLTMKKLLLLLVSSIAFGQVEKKVGDFNKIKILDKMEVTLIPSTYNSIIIDGLEEPEAPEEGEEAVKPSELPDQIVDFTVVEGELQVKRTKKATASAEAVYITINFKNVSDIEVFKGAIVTNDTTIKTSKLSIVSADSSEVTLQLNVENLTCKVEKASMITLEGKAKKQEVIVNEKGIYEAENLETTETVITSNSGQTANINASSLVVANACYKGSITVYGEPMQIYKNRFEGGTVDEQ